MTDGNIKMQPGPRDIAGALALANASSIVAGVIKGLAGKSIADSINGSALVRENIAQLACSRVVKRLQERDRAAKDARLAGYN